MKNDFSFASNVSLSPLFLVNQVFEMEQKVAKLQEANTIQRNINRLKQRLAEAGITYHDPTGEPYRETRTDCDASISGSSTENLVITEVIKPIVHFREGDHSVIVQKAVVIVHSQIQKA